MTRWLTFAAVLTGSAIASYAVAAYVAPLDQAQAPPAPSRATAVQRGSEATPAERMRRRSVRSPTLAPAEPATLDDALATLSEEEIDRWYDGLHLVTSLRVHQFALSGCALDVPAGVLRVRWQARSDASGLRFEEPTILTALAPAATDCARRVLVAGLRADAVEIGGPLSESSVPVVLEIPTTISAERRAQLDALEAMVAARRAQGLPANERSVDAGVP